MSFHPSIGNWYLRNYRGLKFSIILIRFDRVSKQIKWMDTFISGKLLLVCIGNSKLTRIRILIRFLLRLIRV